MSRIVLLSFFYDVSFLFSKKSIKILENIFCFFAIKRTLIFFDAVLIFFGVSASVYFFSYVKKSQSVDRGAQVVRLPQSFQEWRSLTENVVSFFSRKNYKNVSDAELVSFCQKHFLRPAGSEIGSGVANNYYQNLLSVLDYDQKKSLWNLFKGSGFLTNVLPVHREYQYIVIMGGSWDGIASRLMFLDSLVESRSIELTKDSVVYFLVGDRALYPEEREKAENVLAKKREKQPIACETDLPPLLWKSVVRGPLLKRKGIEVLKSYKLPGQYRVNTLGTLNDFLKKVGYKGGKILVVSSNPFVFYQGLTFKTLIMRKGFAIDQVDVVGTVDKWCQSMSDRALGKVLDSFSRGFYQKSELESIRCLDHSKDKKAER